MAPRTVPISDYPALGVKLYPPVVSRMAGLTRQAEAVVTLYPTTGVAVTSSGDKLRAMAIELLEAADAIDEANGVTRPEVEPAPAPEPAPQPRRLIDMVPELEAAVAANAGYAVAASGAADTPDEAEARRQAKNARQREYDRRKRQAAKEA